MMKNYNELPFFNFLIFSQTFMIKKIQLKKISIQSNSQNLLFCKEYKIAKSIHHLILQNARIIKVFSINNFVELFSLPKIRFTNNNFFIQRISMYSIMYEA